MKTFDKVFLYFIFACLVLACLWGWLRPLPKVHDYIAEGDSVRYYRTVAGQLVAERTAAQGSVVELRKHYEARMDSLERAVGRGRLAWNTQVTTLVRDTVTVTLRDTIKDSIVSQIGNFTDGYLAARFDVAGRNLAMTYSYADKYNITGYWRGPKRDTLAVVVSAANPLARVTGLSTLYVARPAEPAPLFTWGVQAGVYLTPAGIQPGVGVGVGLNLRRRRK